MTPSPLEITGRPGVDAARATILAHGTNLETPLPEALHPTDWPGLVEWAEAERIMPLLVGAADDLGGAPPEFAAAAKQSRRAEVIHRLALAHVAVQARDALVGAGIEHRFLKGIATSHLLYANPLDRVHADVDVLVHPRDFPGAIVALTGDFEQRHEDPMYGETSEGLRHSATLVSRKLGGELDLHRRVQARSIRHAIPDELVFSPSVDVEVDGVVMDALGWELQILHAALHLASPMTRLSSAADLIRQLTDPRTDVDRLRAMAAATRLTAALQWATEAAATLVPALATTETGAAIAAYDCPSLERWLWQRSLGGTASRLLVDVIGLGLGGAARLAAEVVWPSQSFLDDRGRTHASHLRYVIDPRNQLRRP